MSSGVSPLMVAALLSFVGRGLSQEDGPPPPQGPPACVADCDWTTTGCPDPAACDTLACPTVPTEGYAGDNPKEGIDAHLAGGCQEGAVCPAGEGPLPYVTAAPVACTCDGGRDSCTAAPCAPPPSPAPTTSGYYGSPPVYVAAAPGCTQCVGATFSAGAGPCQDCPAPNRALAYDCSAGGADGCSNSAFPPVHSRLSLGRQLGMRGLHGPHGSQLLPCRQHGVYVSYE